MWDIHLQPGLQPEVTPASFCLLFVRSCRMPQPLHVTVRVLEGIGAALRSGSRAHRGRDRAHRALTAGMKAHSGSLSPVRDRELLMTCIACSKGSLCVGSCLCP